MSGALAEWKAEWKREVIKEVTREVTAEVTKKVTEEVALKVLKNNKLTEEEIVEYFGLTPEEVRELSEQALA